MENTRLGYVSKKPEFKTKGHHYHRKSQTNFSWKRDGMTSNQSCKTVSKDFLRIKQHQTEKPQGQHTEVSVLQSFFGLLK